MSLTRPLLFVLTGSEEKIDLASRQDWADPSSSVETGGDLRATLKTIDAGGCRSSRNRDGERLTNSRLGDWSDDKGLRQIPVKLQKETSHALKPSARAATAWSTAKALPTQQPAKLILAFSNAAVISIIESLNPCPDCGVRPFAGYCFIEPQIIFCGPPREGLGKVYAILSGNEGGLCYWIRFSRGNQLQNKETYHQEVLLTGDAE